MNPFPPRSHAACWPQPTAEVCARRIAFLRDEHVGYILSGISHLSPGFVALDASRPWLCYWMVHALDLLGHPLSAAQGDAFVDFLSRCQDHEGGGFAGGPVPGQAAHLAPTYAAVLALLSIGTKRAYAAIDRPALRRFIVRMKSPGGGFCMHDDGECDVRGAYCALTVASLCDLLDDEISAGASAWISRCQTYEGGFGATPGEEAHGGYTFCGLAALLILDEASAIDRHALAYWLSQRQQPYNGGFEGRTNKLVDACYSFWQGASFPLLDAALAAPTAAPTASPTASPGCLLNARALLDYLMVCAQCGGGGLRDKPGRQRDYYHTCYGLSGLSVAATAVNAEPAPDAAPSDAPAALPADWVSRLRPTNPLYNICADKVERAMAFFSVGVSPEHDADADDTGTVRVEEG